MATIDEDVRIEGDLEVTGTLSYVDDLLRARPITEAAGTYTATEDDFNILADATAGAFTITLPNATTRDGWEYTIKKIDASAFGVTIDGNGSQTIDGVLTMTLTTQYQKLKIVAHDGNWYVV